MRRLGKSLSEILILSLYLIFSFLSDPVCYEPLGRAPICAVSHTSHQFVLGHTALG